MSVLVALTVTLICFKADNEIVTLIALCIAGLCLLYRMVTEKGY